MHSFNIKAEYIGLYADRIGLKDNLKLRHEVIKCEPNYDYEESGKWRLTVKDLVDDFEFSDIFDGVMICTGQTQRKEVPKFEGQDIFRGTIIHSHEYKYNKGFENKTVVVVGCGVSGADIAVEVSEVSSKVSSVLFLIFNQCGNTLRFLCLCEVGHGSHQDWVGKAIHLTTWSYADHCSAYFLAHF